MNEILLNADRENEEEKRWQEAKTLRELANVNVPIITQTENQDSQPSPPAAIAVTQAEVLAPSSETWKEVASPSLKLIDDSASDLHSHMRKILDTEDVRPIMERTEQAVACAREIALLIKTKSDLIRAVRD